MAKSDLPPADVLRQLLRYEPETGKLFWLERPREMFGTEVRQRQWNTRHAGTEAFIYSEPSGYLCGQIFSKRQRAHIVAWAISYGEAPSGTIDHINHDPSDNRLCNLRQVTQTANSRNQAMRKNNTSGITGVFRFRGKWGASITVDRKALHLGYFETIQEAAAARQAAERKYGFHENHGT
jgi:hypothetical protein